MRFLLVLSIWVVFVGAVSLYVAKRATVPVVDERRPSAARAAFALELTTSFDVAPDPFALGPGDSSSGIVIRGGGADLERRDRLAAGTALRLEPIPGLVQGRNELYIEASPPLGEADRPHAIRVRVFRGQEIVLERILWAEPGSRVASTVLLDLTDVQDEGSKDGH